MNQAITIAKVRKETKITVPAGGFVILVGPDKPWAEHDKARRKIAAKFPINDDYELVAIGHITNSHPDLKLVTAEENKAEQEEIRRRDEAIAKSIRDAEDRAAKFGETEAQKAQKEHQARVAKLNAVHDAIRSKGAVTA